MKRTGPTANSAEAMVGGESLSISPETDGAVDDLRPLVAARNSFPSLAGSMERLLLSLQLCRMGSTRKLVAIHRLRILGPRKN